MSVRILRAAAVLAAALLMFPLTPASAEAQITISSATLAGDTVTVSGTAAFSEITEPHSVVGDFAIKSAGAAGGSEAGNMAGLGLVDATILPIEDGLRFTWVVNNMPEQGIPPEVVRYNWGFKIGDRLFQLQAKSSNMVNATTIEDPVGHVQHARSGKPFFQLRGACVTEYLGTPIQGCYHLAFLEGEVDPAAGTISVDLPFNTKDSIGRLVAPEFVEGEILTDNGGEGTAGMSIAASFQAVVSNTITSQYINGYDSFYIGEHLDVAVGRPGQNPAGLSYTPATRSGDAFTATVPQGAPTNTVAYVRACEGTVCTYANAFIA